MKRKSPIAVETVQFYTYEHSDANLIDFSIDQVPFDNRRDFAVDNNLAGIAVKLEIGNERNNMGARRIVRLSLVDHTSRCEVASQTLKVNIKKDVCVQTYYANFAVGNTALNPGHAYKLRVCDISSSTLLAETVFHLFDLNNLGHPSAWYQIISAGVRPAWGTDTYKVLHTIDCHDYYVRFTLTPKLEPMAYVVLPELEMRLYYPDGKRVTAQFSEAGYPGYDAYKEGILTVDYPFTTCDDVNGIFYAELLCMEYPVAGFVFDTKAENKTGVWTDSDIEPLDQYSPQSASGRLNTLLQSAELSSPD